MLYILLGLIFFVCIGILSADYENKKKAKGKPVNSLSSRSYLIIYIIATASVIGFFIKASAPKEKKAEEVYIETPEEIALNDDIRSAMTSAGAVCLDVGKRDNLCVWVYTVDNGENRDGLAKSLCYTAQKHGVKCVSIFDVNQKRLGRSFCD